MAYQLVFKFLLPIYRTTKQMRQGFRDMQNGMDGHANGSTQTASKASEKKVGDYIDFEEVKDK